MKNYREQSLPFRCATCTHCFTKSEYDEYDTHFCTDGADQRPKCISVLMDESCLDMSQDDRYAEYNAWDSWSDKNKVSENGICEHYEKKEEG